MAELADARDLKSGGPLQAREGSSPSPATSTRPQLCWDLACPEHVEGLSASPSCGAEAKCGERRAYRERAKRVERYARSRTTNMTWHVYIALLQDGRFYVGMTHLSPSQRARDHSAGKGGPYTESNPIVRVLWSEAHSSSLFARKREQQLKKWTHAKKEALINGDWSKLKSLSRSKQG